MLLQQAMADIYSQASNKTLTRCEEDRKDTYNVILRRVHGTVFAVEKHDYYIFRQWVFVILISSKQCACAILSCGLPDSTLFFHIIS